jgi:hypothetical protein
MGGKLPQLDSVIFLMSKGRVFGKGRDDHGWIFHYCNALRYYEPDTFDSLYDSLADCIIANQGEPPL